jgi:hypothetical protein
LRDFYRKRWELLWRGSRDGFDARDFHSRCDGHANTLTLIQDVSGNLFGAFTPVEWESRSCEGNGDNCYKDDDSLKSFLFTLKNPRNMPGMLFPILEHGRRAIICNLACGPCFGDIVVSDNCNANTNSCAGFGSGYIDKTTRDTAQYFTASSRFKVKEIEVFEIME